MLNEHLIDFSEATSICSGSEQMKQVYNEASSDPYALLFQGKCRTNLGKLYVKNTVVLFSSYQGIELAFKSCRGFSLMVKPHPYPCYVNIIVLLVYAQ